MNELLQAAKAVIEATDTGDRWCAIANLSAAVERAEKQEAVGFDCWWGEHSIEWEWTLTEIDAKRFWTAAQQAERERIKAIVLEHFSSRNMVAIELLEKIDDF